VIDGALIGAGVGALIGLIPDHYDDCEECHDSFYASIGVGAGVGLLVDVLRVTSTASSPSQPRTSLLLGVGSPIGARPPRRRRSLEVTVTAGLWLGC